MRAVLNHASDVRWLVDVLTVRFVLLIVALMLRKLDCVCSYCCFITLSLVILYRILGRSVMPAAEFMNNLVPFGY